MADSDFQILILVSAPFLFWALNRDRSSFAAANPLLVRLTKYFLAILVAISAVQQLIYWGVLAPTAMNSVDHILGPMIVLPGIAFLILYARSRMLRVIAWLSLLRNFIATNERDSTQ